MRNCLVTKLKGVVQNDNLMKFGHYRVTISGIAQTNPQWVSGVGCTVSLVSGNAKANIYYNFVSTDGNSFVLDVDKKYTETYIGYWLERGEGEQFTLQDLEYFPALVKIEGTNAVSCLFIDLKAEQEAGRTYPKYYSVDFRCALANGNISYIPSVFPNIVQGILFNTYYIYGSVEDFIRVFRTMGKTDGSFQVSGWVRNANITFNGHTLESESYDSMAISWTETTMTITKTNGETETINA